MFRINRSYRHNLHGPTQEKIEIGNTFDQIDQLRKHMIKKHIPPGGQDCQDPCTFDFLLTCAADVLS